MINLTEDVAAVWFLQMDASDLLVTLHFKDGVADVLRRLRIYDLGAPDVHYKDTKTYTRSETKTTLAKAMRDCALVGGITLKRAKDQPAEEFIAVVRGHAALNARGPL